MKNLRAFHVPLILIVAALACPADPAAAIDICGNGICGGFPPETCSTCPQDCGICFPACSYPEPWWPFWSGQSAIPAIDLTIKVEGSTLLTDTFCDNDIWVKLGEYRRFIKEEAEEELLDVGWGPWSADQASVAPPLRSFTASLAFMSGGDWHLTLETGGLQGNVDLPCPTIFCPDVHVDFSFPRIIATGNFRATVQTIENWQVSYPGSDIDADINVSIIFGLWSFLLDIIVDEIVENIAFGELRSFVEDVDPNDFVSSLLGDGFEIRVALAAAGILGVPPAGTGVTVQVSMPPSTRTGGGSVTVEVFLP